MARAQEHLDKFVKEHGEHPSVANAALAGADFAADQAIDKLMQARAVKVNAEQDRLLAEARQAFEDCRPRFADAAKRFEAQRAELPKAPTVANAPGKRAQIANTKTLAERNRVEAGLAESLLKSAIVDYQIAQTYLQPSNEDRRKALTTAAEAFDKLYRQHGNNSDIGIQAHFWKGKSLDELGDASTAIDIYDEVLVMAPEAPKASPDTAPFYAQVALSRLKLLAKQNKNKEALEDAEAWLEDHKNWNRTRAYQGVALESAKLLLANAADAKGDVKSRLTQQALALLANVGKIESEYQSEAILLRRQHAQGAAAGTSSFDELLALGDEAGRSEKWTDAKQVFAKALEFAEKQKNEQHIKSAKERLTLVDYRIALAAYTAGKLDEAYQHAMRVAAGDPSDPTSSAAAALALLALTRGIPLPRIKPRPWRIWKESLRASWIAGPSASRPTRRVSFSRRLGTDKEKRRRLFSSSCKCDLSRSVTRRRSSLPAKRIGGRFSTLARPIPMTKQSWTIYARRPSSDSRRQSAAKALPNQPLHEQSKRRVFFWRRF